MDRRRARGKVRIPYGAPFKERTNMFSDRHTGIIDLHVQLRLECDASPAEVEKTVELLENYFPNHIGLVRISDVEIHNKTTFKEANEI